MSFMDILRKENNLSELTVMDKLLEYLSNSDIFEAKRLFNTIEYLLNLGIEITTNKEKKLKLKDDVDIYLSSLSRKIPSLPKRDNIDEELAYSVDIFRVFYDWYKKWIKDGIDNIGNQRTVLDMFDFTTKKDKIKNEGEKTLEELNKLINTVTTRVKTSLFDVDETMDRNKQNTVIIFESLLTKASEKEEYKTDFSILKDRGFFNRSELRKLAILIKNIKENKNITSVRMKNKLENQSIIFNMLKKTYNTKRGYEVLENIFKKEQLFLPSLKEDVDIIQNLLSSYKGKKKIKEQTRRLKRILLSKTIDDDIKFFENFGQFQRIIFYAEEMYDNMQEELAEETSQSKAKVDSLFAEYYDMSDTKDKDIVDNVYDDSFEDNQAAGELENFKIFYSTLAWLVFKIKDNNLDYSNKININNNLLEKINLNKSKIYEMYDEKYKHIRLSELTSGLMDDTLEEE